MSARGASVRLRLALAHAALFGALLLALAAAGAWYVERTLRAQADAELAETARLLAAAVGDAAPRAGAGAAHREAVRALRAGHLDVLLFDPAAGRVVSRTAPARGAAAVDSGAWPALLAAALAQGAGVDLAVFGLREGADDERRVAALPVGPPAPSATPNGSPAASRAAPGLVLVAVRDLRDVRAVVDRLWTAMAVALPAALLVALGLGYVLARRSLAPVLAMSAQAARIGAAAGAPGAPAGDEAGGGGSPLRARLVPRNPDDELGRLAGVFNALLDRLAAALEQQRQFMADASHELRTPAAVVRAAADVALRRDDRSAAEYRQALELARTEADRLARIVDDLFLLARTDAGQPTLRASDFYLDEALADCARAMRAVAEPRGVAVVTALDVLGNALPDTLGTSAGADDGAADDGDADGAPMRGDEALVRRLVLNLLDNALKYTPRGGRVTLRLAPDALAADPSARAAHGPARVRPAWRVEVEDTGPGVPPEARTRIFDRFFRSEAHAVREPSGRSGAGLGLAMARTIAEAHGGRLELSRSDASGSLFVAVLPRDGPAGG